MKLVIVDSGGANIGSIQYALARLNVEAELSANAEKILSADRLILPGVGSAKRAMEKLHTLNLVHTIRLASQPILGICLGMQLLFEHSEEGDAACLGLIPGKIKRMQQYPEARIPHMGWNAIKPLRDSPLMQGLDGNSRMYFVHSFAAPINSHSLASVTHHDEVAAIVQHKNFYGAQFHPERSSSAGAQLLKNFLSRTLC